jgi:hypothetical protein
VYKKGRWDAGVASVMKRLGKRNGTRFMTRHISVTAETMTRWSSSRASRGDDDKKQDVDRGGITTWKSTGKSSPADVKTADKRESAAPRKDDTISRTMTADIPKGPT